MNNSRNTYSEDFAEELYRAVGGSLTIGGFLGVLIFPVLWQSQPELASDLFFCAGITALFGLFLLIGAELLAGVGR